MADEPYPVGSKVYVTYMAANHTHWVQDEPAVVIRHFNSFSGVVHVVYCVVFMDGATLVMSARGVSLTKGASEYSRMINEQKETGNELAYKVECRSGGEPV